MSTTLLLLLGAAVLLYLVIVIIMLIPTDTLATITEHPVATAFFTLVVSVILVVGLTIFFFEYGKDFLENIMVEAHGMVLDILVIGLFILWLNKLGEKRLENKRYQEEIDDFRHWRSEEAAYRIAGNIKRLNRNGISKIDLSSCNLAPIILNGTNLKGAHLEGAHLEGAHLSDAHLRGAHLNGAHLRGADLRGADLREARLHGTDLTESKNLTEEQIQSADKDGYTIPPDYLKRPI
jgi:hypothetical protein